MQALLLFATLLVSTLFGVVALRAPSAAIARRRAIIGAFGVLLFAMAAIALWATHPAESIIRAPFFGYIRIGLDDMGARILGFATAIAALVLIGAPRTAIDAPVAGSILLIEAATATLVSTWDTAILALAWCALSTVPWAIATRREPRLQRTLAIYLCAGALPLVAGVFLLGILGISAHLDAPFDLRALAAHGIPPGYQAVLFPLFAIAITVRMAIVPFHSWLPAAIERGPLPFVILLVGPKLGAFLATRLPFALLPDARAHDLRVLGWAGILTVVYGAVLALAQRNIRRLVGFILISQSGLLLLGIASGDPIAWGGVGVQSATLSFGAAALLLLLSSLEARVGAVEIGRIAGIVHRAPRMTATFFLAAAALAGLPGTLGFVGEDLLLEGVLHDNRLIAFGVLFATALNGFTLLRAASMIFLGRQTGNARQASALLLRERVSVLILIAAVVVLAFVPGSLIPASPQAVGAAVHAAPGLR